MSMIVPLAADVVTPSVQSILKLQGVPNDRQSPELILTVAQRSISIFRDLVDAVGILREVAVDEFAVIYRGEGRNAPDTPLADIFPKADRLALFAATVGESAGLEVTRLFGESEFALAVMLDSAASEGAELAAQAMVAHYRKDLVSRGAFPESRGVLEFSPGYCGWHVTGQKKLFEHLHPEGIGVTLNDSCLMQPLKSISGVIVVGPQQIFGFDDSYSICDDCRAPECPTRRRGPVGSSERG